VSLNHDLVGVSGDPIHRTWTSTDVMLYALAVGAGQEDAQKELEFTTENTAGVELNVLPTFANMLAMTARPQVRPMGTFDRSKLLHGEQSFVLHRPIPANGTARTIGTITGMYDKGKAALIVSEAVSTDAATGALLAACRTALYVRGEGGFGGDPGQSSDWEYPGRQPDMVVTTKTRPEQALLYRLTGDRNPLHSDPAFASRGGFSRPILHGMCTYGYTGRLLLHAVCGSDPARFKSMEGRFSKTVLPGDDLSVAIWVDGETAYFRTTSNNADTVIDRGRLTFTAGERA
jgi:acyl dehydratase